MGLWKCGGGGPDRRDGRPRLGFFSALRQGSGAGMGLWRGGGGILSGGMSALGWPQGEAGQGRSGEESESGCGAVVGERQEPTHEGQGGGARQEGAEQGAQSGEQRVGAFVAGGQESEHGEPPGGDEGGLERADRGSVRGGV
jgi:hypothetical protein